MATARAKLPVPILRDPASAGLWFIQASTQVGGNMALYALTILVFATTRSNTAVSAASLFPVLIAGPVADAISGQVVIAITAAGVVVLAVWSAIVFGPRPRSDRAVTSS